MRRIVTALGAAALIALAFIGYGYREARSDPVVRRAKVSLPGWPAGAKPVTVALLSDIHMGSAAMDPERLSRIVAQVNALHPDMVLLAGDFVYGLDARRARPYAHMVTAPLSRLRAPLGTLAVLGNHDWWTSSLEVRAALADAGVEVLANQAVQRGPLVVLGLDDAVSHHAAPARAIAAARGLTGARLVLGHEPEVGARLNGEAQLMLSGHTHCGQIVVPGIGMIARRELFNQRYRCGLVRDDGRATIVSAGLGASVLPLRLGAPPDLWLVTISG